MSSIAFEFIFLIVVVAFAICRPTRRQGVDAVAQRNLDRYISQVSSAKEIGKTYERYIGYLYEKEGYNVAYNGAVNAFADMGRDLIVRSPHGVIITQTKCWAKFKLIQEKHIFQLFGSMTHFERTSLSGRRAIKAVFYTSSKYSEVAVRSAEILGVELRTRRLDISYPMVKCCVSPSGAKLYYLPFDAKYDRVKIDYRRGEYFVKTVKEAVERGFHRGEEQRKNTSH